MKSNESKPREKIASVNTRLSHETSAVNFTAPVLLDIHQLAKALNVGRTTVENWTRTRKIPCLKIKRVLRYDLQKVLAALSAYERKAISL